SELRDMVLLAGMVMGAIPLGGASVAVGAALVFAGLTAVQLSRTGRTFGFKRVVISRGPSKEDDAPSVLRALWRQLLFILWAATSIVTFGIGWLVISSIAVRASKRQRNFYDTLAATVPIDAPRSQGPTHEDRMSIPPPGLDRGHGT